jgi:glucokinase
MQGATRQPYDAIPPSAGPAAAPAVRVAAHVRSFLAADIGGTHARLALVAWPTQAGTPEVLAYEVYRCADHPHLEDLVHCFLDTVQAHPRDMVLACAGYEHAGMVVNRNLAWPVMPAQLAANLGMRQVRLLNDFEALGYATTHLAPDNTALLKPGQGKAVADGPVLIVGPGTGLGAAVRLPGSPDRVLVTEAGQTQLAARPGIEQEVYARLALQEDHVPYEAVLSGPGLLRIYRALCVMRDRYPTLSQPADVTDAALADPSSLAGEALGLFCGWLGSFTADLCLLYGATGGVYLAGGFLSRMLPFMQGSDLVHRFVDKGVMRPFLNRIPIHVVDHGQLGVIGAASWFLHANDGTAGEMRPSVGASAGQAPGDRG